MKMISLKEYAANLGISTRRAATLAAQGRIKGAQKLGDGKTCGWIVPEAATDPRRPAGRPQAPGKKKKGGQG